MKRFEIFYEDSVVRGSTLQEWESAPSIGVQAIIFLHDNMNAREKLHGFDKYSLLDGVIVGVDDPEPLDGSVKYGLLISTDKFNSIIDTLEQNSLIWNFTFTGSNDENI